VTAPKGLANGTAVAFCRTMGRAHLGMVLVLGTLAFFPASPAASAVSRCSIMNSAGVSFGVYNSHHAAPLDSAGSVAVECVGVAASDTVTIAIGRSRHGTFIPRMMSGPSSRFEYNLYLDAARTTVWGDGTSGTSTYVLRPVDGQTVSVPIFGRIPAHQNLPPGVYSDLLILTVLY
jgi:spore coat protein U-like protein